MNISCNIHKVKKGRCKILGNYVQLSSLKIILYDSVELKIKDIKMLLMKKHYTFIQGSKRQKVFKKEINDGITA